MRLLLALSCIGCALAARVSMHKAADDGDVPPLKVAIDGRRNEYEGTWVKPDINGENKKGQVALHLAVCNKRQVDEAVKALLDKGADADAKDGKGETALHVVARMCSHRDSYYVEEFERRARSLTKLLIAAGANVDAPSLAEAVTPLHRAAEGGHHKLVELLLAKGATVDAADAKGATPLHYAAKSLKPKVVLALLRAGADEQLADGAGQTPYAVVADGKDSFASKIREQLQRAQTIRNEVREEKQRRAEAKKEKREAEAKAKGEL